MGHSRLARTGGSFGHVRCAPESDQQSSQDRMSRSPTSKQRERVLEFPIDGAEVDVRVVLQPFRHG